MIKASQMNKLAPWSYLAAVIIGTLNFYPAFADGTVSVTHIEAVQTIQDDKGSVPLIAGKKTFLRVFFSYTDDLPETGARGDLVVEEYKSKAPFSSINSIYLDKLHNSKLNEKRRMLNGGLVFLLEPIPAGTIHVKIKETLRLRNGKVIHCTNCNNFEKSLTFVDGFPLDLVIVSITYYKDNKLYAPDSRAPSMIAALIEKSFPVSHVNLTIQELDSENPANEFINEPYDKNNNRVDMSCHLINTRINDLIGSQSYHDTGPTRYYGIVAGNMRGCAEGHVASGPESWGRAWGGAYAAHELGHTFDRHHPQSLCGDLDNDPRHPDPSWPADIDKTAIGSETKPYVGFYPIDQYTLRPLPWSSTADIMTYCQTTWPSAYTYGGICRKLAWENYSIDYSMCYGSDEFLPANSNFVEPDKSADARRSHVAAGAQVSSEPLTYVVTGSVDLDANKGEISQVTTAERNPRDANKRGPDAIRLKLQAFDAEGQLLNEGPAWVYRNSELPSADKRGIFSGEIAYQDSVARIALINNGVVAAEVRSNGTPPSKVKLHSEPPVTACVRGSRGAYGSGWGGGYAGENAVCGYKYVYRWSNEDNAPLKYTVQLKTDKNRNWQTVAIGTSNQSITIKPSWIKEASEFQVRVRASNGINEAVTTGLPVKVKTYTGE